MVASLRWLNVALRGVMEAGIVAALGYWGFAGGPSPAARILLGIGAPVVVFGVWGAIDFRGMGRMAEALRLTEELLLSGLAAVALYVAGPRGWAWGLAALSVLHHGLVYACGDRLLKARP